MRPERENPRDFPSPIETDPMRDTARLIDANANRAAEGLRVLEDIARFTLDRPDLSERAKGARHTLRRAIGSIAPRAVESRDTAGDVGTSITNPTESDRGAGLPDLIRANAKRAQEALRVLEEAAKLLGKPSPELESTRYLTYDLERDLLGAIDQTRCPQWKLCVLVSHDTCVHHTPSDVILAAVSAGADAIQIREKSGSDRDRLARIAPLVELTNALGVHSIVNDRPDLARLTGASAVHLGRGDIPIDRAREILRGGQWIGLTCATMDDIELAIALGADSVGIGPMFPSTTKPKPTIAGPDFAQRAAERLRPLEIPHLAISGINQDNIPELTRAGVRGVAVSAAVCGSEDPGQAVRGILDALEHGASATANP